MYTDNQLKQALAKMLPEIIDVHTIMFATHAEDNYEVLHWDCELKQGTVLDTETKENFCYYRTKFSIYLPVLEKRIEKSIENCDIMLVGYKNFGILLTNIFYRWEHR